MFKHVTVLLLSFKMANNVFKGRELYSLTIFTSGVSKMCLTCIRLVMCQVYFETEASGEAASLTSADKRNSVFITFTYIFPINKTGKSNR